MACRRWTAAGLAAVGFVGCGGPAPTARLTGLVTIGGAPPTVPLMVVVENAELGVSAAAAVDSGGRFEVRTAPGRGTPEGTYRVALITPPTPIGDIADSLRPGGRPLGTTPAVPEALRSPATSGLSVDVRLPETVFDIAVPAGGSGEQPAGHRARGRL